MTADRIAELRAEQRGRRGSTSQYDADGLRILWHLSEAALTEALDIAEERGKEIGYLASGEMGVDVPALQGKFAEQERLLERAKAIFERESLRVGSIHGEIESSAVRQFLTDLDARDGK